MPNLSEQLREALPQPDLDPEDQDLTGFEVLVPKSLSKVVQEQAKDLQFASTITGFIAEWAKEEPARKVFKEIQSMDLLLQVFVLVGAQKQSVIQVEAFINTLRALANLCFDFDENRDDILACDGGIDAFVAATDYPDSKITLTAYKAILNISMDNELVQSALMQAGLGENIVGAINAIQVDEKLPIAGVERDIVVAAIKVWSSVLESDTGLEVLINGSGINAMYQCISRMQQVITSPPDSEESNDYDWAIEVMDAMSIVLETISENDKAQKVIVQSNILSATMDFIESTSSHERPENDQDEIEDGTEQTTLESVKHLLAKVVTSTTMSDGNMRYLIERGDIISRFLSWTSVASDGDLSDEIRMSGALCLGNIGRSDETCVKLVKTYHIEDALLHMVDVEYQRLAEAKYNKDETKHVIKVIHAVLGALKNLSLATEIRPVLGEKRTIESIVRLFEIEHIQPLFISIVGIIKNLCAGTVEGVDCNIYRVLTSLEPPTNTTTLDSMPLPATLADPKVKHTTHLSRIIKVVWNTAKESEGAGVRNEGGRLLVHIVKAIHRTSATQFLPVLLELNAITLILQILTGAHLTTPSVNDTEGHAQFDAPPESTRVFPLVQNESIVALTLLCSMNSSTIGQIYQFRSVMPTLLQILSEKPDAHTEDPAIGAQPAPTYSIQTMMNTVLLLQFLVSFNGFEEKEEVVETLERLVDPSVEESPGVEFQFQIVISQVLEAIR